ncbi:MAG TPA: hypothetical protein DCS07_01305 [Bdellovibrionales bacterium]|nr:MAG: hypothetical protein A2Z97_15970 [Bdellovibrionales bacterium GWB1_52_6]OFZ03073.1 MAG: hypothetical protein A2X97_09540 [Bdellovibrionales bacterium GWA1_52_35]OFZ43292.1 MAG: hypothetical protein A2070_07640 [Bdellovibrionales bacterium GWC1_52_8]HAR41263.1 hypothetical protein [Bdellovibrionales bacterium]HCM40399.1 hypothetical protein [Bdellovibrionales bacterium]
MSESTRDKLIEVITPLVAPLGYDIVYLEAQTGRQNILRIFIDHKEETAGSAIGIEDCVKVARTLDEPLDLIPEINHVFNGAYELEVSSPGIDRPLRIARDYNRFAGREARIHLFRPLTAEESGNPEYQAKNPKQKNFLGTLMGMQNDKVRLALSAGQNAAKTGSHGKKGKAAKAVSNTNRLDEVTIPLPLISKANLEPQLGDFEIQKESQS